MDSAFSHLSLLIFALFLSFYALIAQSHDPYVVLDRDDTAHSMAARSPPPPHSSRFHPGYDGPQRGSFPIPPHDETRNGRPLRSPPNHHYRYRIPLSPPPPPPPHGMNAGQKLGLLFVGIAAIMQVGIVGFLVIKRRQLLKSSDRYETCT